MSTVRSLPFANPSMQSRKREKGRRGAAAASARRRNFRGKKKASAHLDAHLADKKLLPLNDRFFAVLNRAVDGGLAALRDEVLDQACQAKRSSTTCSVRSGTPKSTR